TLARVHEFVSLVNELTTSEDRLPSGPKSGLPESCLFPTHLRRRLPKLAPERISEVTVTGKTQLERQRREIARTFRESFQRHPQTKLREVSMDRHAGLLLKNPRQVKRRRMNSARHVVERDSFIHSRRQIRLRRFSSLGVIRVCAFAFRLARHA